MPCACNVFVVFPPNLNSALTQTQRQRNHTVGGFFFAFRIRLSFVQASCSGASGRLAGVPACRYKESNCHVYGLDPQILMGTPMSFASMPMSIEDRLRRVGLRPTRQRRDLAQIIFRKGDRHFTAEDLQGEAEAAGIDVSLATIYNNLHQFTGAGLLRPLSMDGNRTFFDTNTSNHNHFLVEGDNEVIDIPDGAIAVNGLPEAPEGYEISHVDVIVRLRRKG